MTGYVVVTGGATGPDLGIKAGTRPLRIVRLDFSSNDTGNFVNVYRHSGDTLSGGSAISIVPLREAAPASTATALTGSLTYSGTSSLIANTFVGAGRTSTIDGTVVLTYITGSSGQIQTSLSSLTIPSGQVLQVAGGITNNCLTVVWFEEIPLPGSY